MYWAAGLVLALGLSLVVTTPAQATIYQAHRCDNCSTAEHMKGVAVQNGVGIRYVYSVPNGQIRKFHVERWCSDDPQNLDGPIDRDLQKGTSDQSSCALWQYAANESPAEADVASFMIQVRAAYQAYGNSFQGFEPLQFSELVPLLGRTTQMNAYDFVSVSNNRTTVLNAYGDALDMRNFPPVLMNLMRPVITFASQGIGINMNLQNVTGLRSRLTFNDGSQVFMRIENSDMVAYLDGSARDANGALIPDHSHAPGGVNHDRLVGTHHTSNPSAWHAWASQLGIPVTSSGNTGGFQCGRVNGGPIHCVRI